MSGLPSRRGRKRSVSTSPFQNLCPRCDEQIVYYRDATKSRGGWIHKKCASGQDDV